MNEPILAGPMTKKLLVKAAQAFNQWYVDENPKPPTGKVVPPIKGITKKTVAQLEQAILKPDVLITDSSTLPTIYRQVLAYLIEQQEPEQPPANPPEKAAQAKKRASTKASERKPRETADRKPQRKKVATPQATSKTTPIVLDPNTRQGVFASVISQMNDSWHTTRELTIKMHQQYKGGMGSERESAYYTDRGLAILHALGLLEGRRGPDGAEWRKTNS